MKKLLKKLIRLKDSEVFRLIIKIALALFNKKGDSKHGNEEKPWWK